MYTLRPIFQSDITRLILKSGYDQIRMIKPRFINIQDRVDEQQIMIMAMGFEHSDHGQFCQALAWHHTIDEVRSAKKTTEKSVAAGQKTYGVR